MHSGYGRRGRRGAGSLLFLLAVVPQRGRTDGIVDAAYMRRLDCADSKNWTDFRHLLVARMEAGAILGRDLGLQEAAEGLLAHVDAQGSRVLEELGQDFLATLLGQRRGPSRSCFAGYQAACLARVLRYAAEEAERGDGFENERQRQVYQFLQSNSLFCADLFGKDAALEFLSSTSWPTRLLDLEVHMRSSAHPAVTKRKAEKIPPGA
ncbi:CDC2 [Symbiodinium natans]|uniref:CDC2 protein n=1 Tax=Symbiodinium natans TaxID=878477 RepID=A0A812Q9W8_9DINO|nr:CDC2 [Symbiodinium natans]